MSYSKLENLCETQSNTLTNNRKFLMPANSVYLKQYQLMYRFPGENANYLDAVIKNNEDPLSIKAFDQDRPIKNNHCSSCK